MIDAVAFAMNTIWQIRGSLRLALPKLGRLRQWSSKIRQNAFENPLSTCARRVAISKLILRIDGGAISTVRGNSDRPLPAYGLVPPSQ
jgi:hypothetical protein